MFLAAEVAGDGMIEGDHRHPNQFHLYLQGHCLIRALPHLAGETGRLQDPVLHPVDEDLGRQIDTISTGADWAEGEEEAPTAELGPEGRQRLRKHLCPAPHDRLN